MTSGFLLDTNVISEFVRSDQSPEPKVERWLYSLDRSQIYTSVLVCGEIQKGIEQLGPGKRRSQLERWLERDLNQWLGPRILAVDSTVCICWGRLTIAARNRGIQVPVIDGLLVATAIHHRLTVATRNSRHFADLGAEVFNPWLAP